MFTRSEATNFIEKCFGDSEASNGGLNVSVVCPICKKAKGATYNKRKLVIRTTDFFLHCWACGYKSKTLLGLLYRFRRSFVQEFQDNFGKDLKTIDFQKVSEDAENFVSSLKQKIHSLDQKVSVDNSLSNEICCLPKNFKLLSLKPYGKRERSLFNAAYDYLINQRKITEQQILDYNIGIVTWFEDYREKLKFENRIIFPSISQNGVVSFYTTRAILPDMFPRYTNSSKANDVVFNSFLLNLHNTNELTLVEGPFDYICSPYINTVPLLGSSVARNSALYNFVFQTKPEKIRIILDKNEAAKANRIANELFMASSSKIEILIGNINHPVAKDFAEIQQLEGVATKDFVEEFLWHPLTLKEKILKRLS